MNKTKIDWADRVWNFISGCTKVSPGCKYCYAEVMAKRFWKTRKFSDVQLNRLKLSDPLALTKKGQRIFVNSISDFFYETLDPMLLATAFAVMAKCPDQTFIILTKRPQYARDWFLWFASNVQGQSYFDHMTLEKKEFPKDIQWPLPNVWIGVSVEDQEREKRLWYLDRIPAAKHIVSLEPQLEYVRFATPWTLDWIIQGGESGPRARKFDLKWAEDTLKVAREYRIPYFFKQAGSFYAKANNWNHTKGGNPDEWPEHLRVREYPSA